MQWNINTGSKQLWVAFVEFACNPDEIYVINYGSCW